MCFREFCLHFFFTSFFFCCTKRVLQSDKDDCSVHRQPFHNKSVSHSVWRFLFVKTTVFVINSNIMGAAALRQKPKRNLYLHISILLMATKSKKRREQQSKVIPSISYIYFHQRSVNICRSFFFSLVVSSMCLLIGARACVYFSFLPSNKWFFSQLLALFFRHLKECNAIVLFRIREKNERYCWFVCTCAACPIDSTQEFLTLIKSSSLVHMFIQIKFNFKFIYWCLRLEKKTTRMGLVDCWHWSNAFVSVASKGCGLCNNSYEMKSGWAAAFELFWINILWRRKMRRTLTRLATFQQINRKTKTTNIFWQPAIVQEYKIITNPAQHGAQTRTHFLASQPNDELI